MSSRQIMEGQASGGLADRTRHSKEDETMPRTRTRHSKEDETMPRTMNVVPIDYHPASREIATQSCVETPPATLFELIAAVGDVCEQDEEVVATVLSLLESGRVRLCIDPLAPAVEKLCG